MHHRVSALFCACIVACGGVGFSQEQARSPEENIAAMQSDSVPRNAGDAYREIYRLLASTEMRVEFAASYSGPLTVALKSEDHQLRHCAALLLIRYFRKEEIAVSKWPNDLVPVLIEALYDDEFRAGNIPIRKGYGSRGNAREASVEIGRALRDPQTGHEFTSLYLEPLKETLKHGDYQSRHCTALLLLRYYEEEAIAESEWPETIFLVLAEALQDDGLFETNASQALRALYFLESRRPTDSLWAALRGGDRQAQYGAAIVLAKYYANTVQPEITKELVGRLASRDYWIRPTALGAFRALVELGSENMRELLADHAPKDSQEAAYLKLAAAHLNLLWNPSTRLVDEWRAEAAKQNSSLAILALYLSVDPASAPSGDYGHPWVNRLTRLSRNLRVSADRAQWTSTWGRFWYMNMEEDESVRRGPTRSAGWAMFTGAAGY